MMRLNIDILFFNQYEANVIVIDEISPLMVTLTTVKEDSS